MMPRAKKEKPKRKRRVPFKELKDYFFLSPNRYTLVNRDDREECRTVKVDPKEAAQLFDDCQGDSERLMRHFYRLGGKEAAENKKRRAKADSAVALCTFDENPTYPPEVGVLEITKGEKLGEDIVSLLSNGGKRDYLVRCYDGKKVEVIDRLIRNKHVVICCFLVPFLGYTQQAALCRALIQACHRFPEHVQMVIVVKVRSQLDSEEQLEAFRHFLEPFPCLAVPFEDSQCRDYLCRSLGLSCTDCYSPHAMSGIFSAGLVLDSEQKVLQRDVSFFGYYGALSYPFTDARLDELVTEDTKLRFRMDPVYRPPFYTLLAEEEKRDYVCNKFLSDVDNNPLSLHQLLRCRPSFELRNVGDDKGITVSDLSEKKCVGLYLCLRGGLINKLTETYELCAKHGLEFEIVVVSLFSLWDTLSSADKDVRVVLRSKGLSSWWVLPFDYELTRKLCRLVDHELVDKLIILEGASKTWDLQGKEVLDNFGMLVEAYPFTRSLLSQKKLSNVRSLTLEDLLLGPFRDEGITLIRDKVCDARGLTDLKDKIVLVCFSFVDSYKVPYFFFKTLLDSYPHIQAAGAEVLFISLSHSPIAPSDELILPAMPWLRPPFDSPIGAIAGEQIALRSGLLPPLLIAFGKDGLIYSMEAQDHLPTDGGFPDYLFSDDLQIMREEIRKGLYGHAV